MAGASGWILLAVSLIFAVSHSILNVHRTFTVPERCITRRATQAGTEPVVDVDPQAPKASNSFKAQVEKRARVLAKTAETKKRVEEKKRKLNTQSDRKKTVLSNDKPLIDWESLAAQAKRMAEEAKDEAAKSEGKEGKELEVLATQAKGSFFQLATIGFETAKTAPELLAASAGGTLVLVLLLSFSSKPSMESSPIRQFSSAPAVISLKEETPTPQSRTPVPQKLQASNPPSPKPAPKPQPEVPWARGLADSAASTLRSIADGLPGAEKIVEAKLPVAQSAIADASQWASGVNLENAPEKVEKDVLPFAGRAAEEALRLGLKAGAGGLDFVGENLPAAQQAVGSAVDTGLPYAQSALREVASNARRLAAEGIELDSSNPYAQSAASALPEVLKVTASVLDAAADAAPGVKSVLGYAASAVTPVAQAALSTASDLVIDASNVPSSTVEKTLNEAAGAVVDTARSAAKAVDLVKTTPAADSALQLLTSQVSAQQAPQGTE
ncbi:unnamed protein product [Durusdinium trenchii]|uniref:Uncharacterized protein n=1 Tax=Durusdinium trenchii TaxID=1381693 RepID=A0ABP0QLZ3_9DINO